MNKFFVNLSKKDTYQKLLKEPLTYVAGAVLLAVLQIAHFAVLGSGWGVTGAFANWGAWTLEAVGVDAGSWAYFATEKAQKTLAGGFLNDGASIRNVGLVFGALIATLYASQFKIKKIKSKRQAVAAILGGLMMGYGARLALGCNIGALFTAIISLSLSGWVFGAFLFVGAFIGSKLLIKYFM